MTCSVTNRANLITVSIGMIAAFFHASIRQTPDMRHADTEEIFVMSTTELLPHDQAVARLLELSQTGQVENTEFTQLGRRVYESMFETYRGDSQRAKTEPAS